MFLCLSDNYFRLQQSFSFSMNSHVDQANVLCHWCRKYVSLCCGLKIILTLNLKGKKRKNGKHRTDLEVFHSSFSKKPSSSKFSLFSVILLVAFAWNKSLWQVNLHLTFVYRYHFTDCKCSPHDECSNLLIVFCLPENSYIL